MFNPDHSRDLPRVEDTGKRDQPKPAYGYWDVPLLLDTIDELRSRISLVDPGGETTTSDPDDRW